MLAAFGAITTITTIGTLNTLRPIGPWRPWRTLGPGAARGALLGGGAVASIGTFGALPWAAFGHALGGTVWAAVWTTIRPAFSTTFSTAFSTTFTTTATTPAAFAASRPAVPFALTFTVTRAFTLGPTLVRPRGVALALGHVAQDGHVVIAKVDPDTAAQATWQHHRAVANTDEPAHSVSGGLEEFAHFAVAAFGDDHAVPMVHAFATAVFNALEGAVLAVDRHAFEQARLGLGFKHAQRAHGVLTLDAKARVHQPVG